MLQIPSYSIWVLVVAVGLLASPARAATPVQIVTGMTDIHSPLATDGNYLYFGTKGGTLYRASKTGASVQPIAQAGYIFGIAVHDGYVYFGSINDHSIYRIPVDLSTGSSIVIADPSPAFGGLVGVIGSDAYYSIVSGFRKIPISGGTPVDVVTNWNNGSFTADASSIFFNDTSESPYKVHRFDTTTNTLSIVIPDAGVNLGFNRNGSNVFVDATNVYVGTPTIYQAPAQGGTVIPLVTAGTIAPQGGGGAFGYASDGTFVYYAEGPHDGTYTDILKAVPVGGGTPITLASGVSIYQMIYDNGTLYWDVVAEGPGQDAIYRLDISPLSPPSSVQQVQLRPDPLDPQPVPSTIVPPAQPIKKNLVFITHGWNSQVDGVDGWAKPMAEKIRKIIDRRNPPNEHWTIVYWDWREAARERCNAVITNPWCAYVNAGVLGNKLGQVLARAGYDHIHFIAHSAGSHLIENAAVQVKLLGTRLGKTPTIHSTFLDAYDPFGNSSTYGFSATWAEQFVDKRDSVLLSPTNLTLPGAYNFDVSALDPDQRHLGLGGVISQAVAFHAWPYVWYRMTVDDPGMSNFGFVSAIESGRNILLSHDFLPRKEECRMKTNSTVCVRIAPATVPVVQSVPVRNPWDIWGNPSGVSSIHSGTGNTSLTTPQVIKQTTGSPVWVSLVANVVQGFNTLQIDYRFASQAEGLLSVFLDDQVVFKADERQAQTGINRSGLIPLGNATPGVHSLSFRLDHFSAIPSSIEISNITTSNTSIARVLNVNPIANAGSNQIVRLGSPVRLDGSNSSDPDHMPLPLTYSWTQTVGPGVALLGGASAVQTFTPLTKETYTFSLTVNDGQSNSGPANVTITVPILGDIDGDSDVDSNDLARIMSALNTKASGPNDERDLDGDGMISALDARKLTLLCTRPRCATQ